MFFFIMYLICFLVGSFRVMGKVYDYYSFSKRKFNYSGHKDIYIFIAINMLMPYCILSYIFSDINLNSFSMLILIFVCFSAGYSSSSLLIPFINDLIHKNSPFNDQVHQDKNDISIVRAVLNVFSQFFWNIHHHIFKKSYFIKQLECKLCEEDNHFKNKFNNLCKISGLKDIELYFFETGNLSPGFALVNPFFIRQKHSVFLSSYWCKVLKPDEVSALMAHELMHIRNKDGSVMSAFRPLFYIFSLILFYVLLGYVGSFISSFIPFVGFLIMLIYALLILPVLFIIMYLMIDIHGFWEQLREIKADRLSIQIGGVSKESLIALLEKMKKIDEKNLANETWYEKIVIRYKVKPSHPNLQYRIKLIENYKPWSLKDYLFLIFNTIKWALTGKGWSGR